MLGLKLIHVSKSGPWASQYYRGVMVSFSFPRDIPIPALRVIEIEDRGMYSAQMHTCKFLRALFMYCINSGSRYYGYSY